MFDKSFWKRYENEWQIIKINYYNIICYILITDAGMNYSSEGTALLPWERGLPYCSSTTLTHAMSLPNGKSTATVKQTTPASSHNGTVTQLGTNRNGGSTLNNMAVEISVIVATMYFAAKWFWIKLSVTEQLYMAKWQTATLVITIKRMFVKTKVRFCPVTCSYENKNYKYF